ncbi:protein SWOLLEN 1-like [Bidens hawaiensis]|uniref:protein SWOLLEN 1-like n=1 Tax=Bidens hawaiensis TaxID=980011 RepID=UPI00404945D2
MVNEEDSSGFMGAVHHTSPLNTNNAEPSASTRVEPSEGSIIENTPLLEATEDVVLTSQCDDSNTRHEEDTSVSMDTRVKPSEGAATNENTSLPEATEDLVLTLECEDSHMSHEEDASVSMDAIQSVSPLLNTNNTEVSQSTRVEFSAGENTSLLEAAEHVVLTSECDDSHMKHEDSSVSMDKLDSVSLKINTNNTELCQSTRVKSSEDAIDENTSLTEAAEDVVLTSERDDNLMMQGDSSVPMDKLESVSPLVNKNNTQLSQSARVIPSEGAISENTSLPEATEDVQAKEHSISSNTDMKPDKSFTFDVSASASATAGFTETCKGLQLFPTSQSMAMEGSSIDSISTLDPRKPNASPVTQTPGSGTINAATKERKRRRKSVAKESAEKGKETTTTRSRRVEKSSPLLVTSPQPISPAATGQVIQFQESGPKEKVECSVTNPAPIANLPDLNNSASVFHQPFTNNQQVQLRAQILVYGSLISGVPAEEAHMIAAFEQSDAGRKTWEDAWRACLERVHGQKSQANTPMQQPRADLKDAGYKSPDLGIKHSSILSSTYKGTPPAVSPLIPVPSPLWNMSTPSCVGLQSRNAAFQHPFTPIHRPSYQTTPNPLWLSQSPFLGQWGIASLPGSPAPRFSGSPITEAVKLTPVNVSGIGPHPHSIPVVHSALFSPLSNDDKKASSDPKSRRRKKVSAAVTNVPSQVLMTPPSAHLVPRTGAHNRTPLLVENQTDSVTTPVTSMLSTSVIVSAPPASKGSSPARVLSVHDMLKKVIEGNAQEAYANAIDSGSIKKTKITASPAVNQTPVSALNQTVTTPVTSMLSTSVIVSAPPASKGSSPARVLSVHDMLKKVIEGNAQEAYANAIDSGSIKKTKITASPAVNQTPVSALNQTVSVTVPAFCTSFPTSVAMSTPVSTTSYSSQNMGNALGVEETLSNIKESKLLAENAALLAAAEVSNCQNVWSGLDGQNSSVVVSDAEAKLMSSISAAATVAKMASAAAKIATNVAEQARLMADEVFQSRKTGNFSHIPHPNVVNKATPASILKSTNKTTDSHSNSIISAAREAARRRIEAASAASKHAENLDAIVKAAELAAEAVSQVGKIVTMGDSSALRKFAEAGPEGFWKTSQLSYEQHPTSNSGKKNVSGKVVKEIQTLKHGLASPVHLAPNLKKTVINDGSVISNEKDTRTSKVPNLSKAVGVSTVTNIRSPHTYVVGHVIPQNTPGVWEEHNIKEGCLVEVYKENGKYEGAWLAANVLSLKDEKALICYTGIQSSDGENVEEWVAFEVKGSEEVPGIRIAHPMTTMQFEGARKRRRTAVTDYAWAKGYRVDVWMQDCWREGIVMEPNKIDVTTLTVQFPASQGETLVVRSWHVRPTLIWKDRKWIELNGVHTSQGELPKEKRMKLGSPAAVTDKTKDKLPIIVESGTHEEQGTLLLLLSSQETCFNVGKNTSKPTSNLPTNRKDKARVVFGVPKPGKKQKFMAVNTQYADDRTNKNITTSSSNSLLKFPKSYGSRVTKTDAVENQVAETKSRLKPRKPPVPLFRTVTSHDPEPTDVDSVENSLSRQNQTQVAPSSSKRKEPLQGPPAKKPFTFTSKLKSDPPYKGRKLPPTPKIEVKDKSDSQVNETRRSNRKIQPTSRLLEGLQSSLTISKIPSVSHAAQRKVTSKVSV